MNAYHGMTLRQAMMTKFGDNDNIANSIYALMQRYHINVFGGPRSEENLMERINTIEELADQERLYGRATLRQLYQRKCRLVFL